MNTQKLLIGGIVVAIVLSLIGVFKATTIINNPPFQAGATAGPDRYNPCESRDGLQDCTKKVGFISASTTACSIATTATSSLKTFSYSIYTGTSTALTLRLATSTSPSATTTNIASFALSASETDSFIYRGKTGDVLIPGQYVVASFEGTSGVSSGSGLVGACQIDTMTL